jgi:hypothetical protein
MTNLKYIILIALIVYVPTLDNGFINYDDPMTILYASWRNKPFDEVARGLFTLRVDSSLRMVIHKVLWDRQLYDIVKDPRWYPRAREFHIVSLLIHLLAGIMLYKMMEEICIKIFPS